MSQSVFPTHHPKHAQSRDLASGHSHDSAEAGAPVSRFVPSSDSTLLSNNEEIGDRRAESGVRAESGEWKAEGRKRNRRGLVGQGETRARVPRPLSIQTHCILALRGSRLASNNSSPNFVMLLKSFEYLSRVSMSRIKLTCNLTVKYLKKKHAYLSTNCNLHCNLLSFASHLADNMNDSLPEIKVLNWGSIQSKLLKSRNFAF